MRHEDQGKVEKKVRGYDILTREDGETTYVTGFLHTAYTMLGHSPPIDTVTEASAAVLDVARGLHEGDLRGARLSVGVPRVQVVDDKIAVVVAFVSQRSRCGCTTSGPCNHDQAVSS